MIDLDNDGTEEKVIVSVNNECGIAIRLEKHILEYQTIDTDEVDTYIVETEEGYSYIVLEYMNVYNTIDIIAFDNKRPYVIDYIWGMLDKIEGNTLTAICFTDAIGSWNVYREYILSDTVEFVSGESKIVVDPEDCRILVTAIELEVEILEDGVYKTRTLEVGTEICPTATDSKTYMLFTLANGEEGRIFFTKVDYECYVNGIDQYECFEEVLYWG